MMRPTYESEGQPWYSCFPNKILSSCASSFVLRKIKIVLLLVHIRQRWHLRRFDIFHCRKCFFPTDISTSSKRWRSFATYLLSAYNTVTAHTHVTCTPNYWRESSPNEAVTFSKGSCEREMLLWKGIPLSYFMQHDLSFIVTFNELALLSWI
jgi:hypothetical protein